MVTVLPLSHRRHASTPFRPPPQLPLDASLLRGLEESVTRAGGMTPGTPGTLVAALLVLMLAAFTTDAVGIYAVFGAFIAGVAMPRGRFADEAIRHVDLLTTTFLLPVFFVYSGLNTQVGLLDTPALWAIAALLRSLVGRSFMRVSSRRRACWKD